MRSATVAAALRPYRGQRIDEAPPEATSAMRDTVDELRTLDELRAFIHKRLCEKENLIPEQFRMTEMQLLRRGRACGMQFLLQGPRSVRLGAIWASNLNVVYLYDAHGTRYQKISLKYRLRPDPPTEQRPAA